MKSKYITRMTGGFKTNICPECNHEYQTGKQIETDVIKCGNCGKHVDGYFNNYCDNCGEKIEF